MAIEIIPKPKIKEIPWLKVVLYILLAVFLGFLLSYFILIFYQAKLQDQLLDLGSKLSRTLAESELEKDILISKRRIDDFNILAVSHPLPTKIFEILEKNTHPRVWFYDFKLDLERGIMNIDGKPDSFEVLGQQLLIFETKDIIKAATLSEVSIDKEGEIAFKLLLTFDLGILGR